MAILIISHFSFISHKVEHNLCVKEKITKIPKISKLHLEFINGKNIHFDKTNLSIHEPHKIIISNNLSCLVLLIFKNDNNIYIKDSLDTITIKRTRNTRVL